MFKFLVVVLCVSYLLQPLQRPINSILHTVTHIIEIPDEFLSSPDQSSYSYSDNHINHVHQLSGVEHDHQILEFLMSALKGDSQSDKKNKSWTDILELDKHLVSEFKRPSSMDIFERSQLFLSSYAIYPGHLSLPYKPPIS